MLWLRCFCCLEGLRKPPVLPQIHPFFAPGSTDYLDPFLLQPLLLPRDALALVATRRDLTCGGDYALPFSY